MTYKILHNLMVKYAIPANVKLMSDSGWECNATDMDAIYYNRGANTLIFTQSGNVGHTQYDKNSAWELIFKKGE